MGSLSQFEEDAGPLLRGHLCAGKGIGGIGFFKGVENADYFLHHLILLWLFNSGGVGGRSHAEFAVRDQKRKRLAHINSLTGCPPGPAQYEADSEPGPEGTPSGSGCAITYDALFNSTCWG